eukprot:4112637-Pyramimonas_sp.AAC.1
MAVICFSPPYTASFFVWRFAVIFNSIPCFCLSEARPDFKQGRIPRLGRSLCLCHCVTQSLALDVCPSVRPPIMSVPRC